MAVDIALTFQGKRPNPANELISIVFDDSNGDFCLLEEVFQKIYHQTGQLIDLYTNCLFESKNLDILKKELTITLKDIRTKTEEQWTTILEEFDTPIIKKDVISKLEKLLLITELAIIKNEKLIGTAD